MNLGRCDGCRDPIRDAWVALEGPAFVCPTCAPILTRLDALVAAGRLDPDGAADAFSRERWPATPAPSEGARV